MKLGDFKFVRHLLRESDGAEIAEAAAVLPVMFMVLLGIFWFGQAFSIYGAITRAAQDGARAGSAPQCTTCSTTTAFATAAVNAANNSLTASNLDPTLAQSASFPTFPVHCAGYSDPNCGATGVCVQVPVQLLTSAQGGGDCGISVYFQYPFKFWLPFTSINNQQILLTASASARMETN
jgi:Flp pilus assembly protein TadG